MSTEDSDTSRVRETWYGIPKEWLSMPAVEDAATNLRFMRATYWVWTWGSQVCLLLLVVLLISGAFTVHVVEYQVVKECPPPPPPVRCP